MIPNDLLEQVRQFDYIIYKQSHPSKALPWYSGMVIEVRKKTNRGITVRPTDRRVGERTQSIDMNGVICIVAPSILLGYEKPKRAISLISDINQVLEVNTLNQIGNELSTIIQNYRPHSK